MYKGKTRVDLREVYEKEGELEPGKKGAALISYTSLYNSLSQFFRFVHDVSLASKQLPIDTSNHLSTIYYFWGSLEGLKARFRAALCAGFPCAPFVFASVSTCVVVHKVTHYCICTVL